MKIIKSLRDYLAAGLAVLVLSTPALAAYTIRADYGGGVVEYIQKYTDLKEHQGKLKLDGLCMSACTLFLGIMPKKDTCATEGSLLAFHSASAGGMYSSEGTRLVWNMYPQRVQEYLLKRGWNGEQDPHPEFIYAPATDLMEACASGT